MVNNTLIHILILLVAVLLDALIYFFAGRGIGKWFQRNIRWGLLRLGFVYSFYGIVTIGMFLFAIFGDYPNDSYMEFIRTQGWIFGISFLLLGIFSIYLYFKFRKWEDKKYERKLRNEMNMAKV